MSVAGGGRRAGDGGRFGVGNLAKLPMHRRARVCVGAAAGWWQRVARYVHGAMACKTVDELTEHMMCSRVGLHMRQDDPFQASAWEPPSPVTGHCEPGCGVGAVHLSP